MWWSRSHGVTQSNGRLATAPALCLSTVMKARFEGFFFSFFVGVQHWAACKHLFSCLYWYKNTPPWWISIPECLDFRAEWLYYMLDISSHGCLGMQLQYAIWRFPPERLAFFISSLFKPVLGIPELWDDLLACWCSQDWFLKTMQSSFKQNNGAVSIMALGW